MLIIYLFSLEFLLSETFYKIMKSSRQIFTPKKDQELLLDFLVLGIILLFYFIYIFLFISFYFVVISS